MNSKPILHIVHGGTRYHNVIPISFQTPWIHIYGVRGGLQHLFMWYIQIYYTSNNIHHSPQHAFRRTEGPRHLTALLWHRVAQRDRLRENIPQAASKHSPHHPRTLSHPPPRRSPSILHRCSPFHRLYGSSRPLPSTIPQLANLFGVQKTLTINPITWVSSYQHRWKWKNLGVTSRLNRTYFPRLLGPSYM